MIVGIPKGLMFYEYYPFYIRFFSELGAEVVLSPDTNKQILNLGTKYCVDEACLPIKIFHGHCAYLKDKCDVLFIPRIMTVHKGEFICPKFCGLSEMIVNSIPGLPSAIVDPIYCSDESELRKWALKTGLKFTKNPYRIIKAFKKAVFEQYKHECGINQDDFPMKVALIGHSYNVFDEHANMNLVHKLNLLGVGVMTKENYNESESKKYVDELFKRPFWTFEREIYGFTACICDKSSIDGIIYVSSFACGIDSVVIELIKNRIGCKPFLELKLDEHTGEAGFDTRIEAFTDMLKRRKDYGREQEMIQG